MQKAAAVRRDVLDPAPEAAAADDTRSPHRAEGPVRYSDVVSDLSGALGCPS